MGRSSFFVPLTSSVWARVAAVVALTTSLAVAACHSGSASTSGATSATNTALRIEGSASAPQTISVAGTDLSFAMVRVPGGTLRGERIAPFAIGAREVTWDAYLAMVLETDGPPASKDGTLIDGLARPTKPYIATDRGYGQGQRPVISISARGAESFAVWLSLRTGRPFRLATELEWEWAARAGSTGTWSCGDDPAKLEAIAWYAGNANQSTQLVGTKAPNAWGLYDMHGNVAEWCRVAEPDGTKYGAHALRGGSFFDEVEGLAFSERELRDNTWNVSDPQIPKSIWWLANAAWPGMRVVMDIE